MKPFIFYDSLDVKDSRDIVHPEIHKPVNC